MHVTHLSLYDFRNVSRLELSLTDGTTLFYGTNASGKTSLLEALFYVATTRSPRIHSDRELINWDATSEAGMLPFARIVAHVARAAGNITIEVVVQRKHETIAQPAQPPQLLSDTIPNIVTQNGTTKRVRVNQKNVRSLDLVGLLRVVLFTPADLQLVAGAPAERRRYLDITLSQLDTHYVRTLAHYGKLIQQRNSLLRAWHERRRPSRAIDKELEYWDHEIAASGSYIIAERLQAVALLNELAGTRYQTIAGSQDPLVIHYQSRVGSTPLNATMSATVLAQIITQQLHTMRQEELQRGQTLLGPHRDDLLFSVKGIDLGVYGSRGQQRSVAVALKLAEAALMQQRSGDAPLLLLDDVLSELDMKRRSHVLQVLQQPTQQTLLTATDVGHFDSSFLAQTRCVRVEQGRVYE